MSRSRKLLGSVADGLWVMLGDVSGAVLLHLPGAVGQGGPAALSRSIELLGSVAVAHG